MAKILGKKTAVSSKIDAFSSVELREQAFSMYIQLGPNGRPRYTVGAIAKAVGLRFKVLTNIIHYYRWRAVRDHLIFGDTDVEQAKILKDKAESNRSALRKEALAHSISSIADVISELRQYNKLTHRMLMSKTPIVRNDQKKDKFPVVDHSHILYPPRSRRELHIAYVATLKMLIDFFTPASIKLAANELLFQVAVSNQTNRNNVSQQALTGEKQSSAPPTENKLPDIPMESSQLEAVLKDMRKGAINGPENYTGLKATSVVEGVEDAIFAKPGGADSEG